MAGPQRDNITYLLHTDMKARRRFVELCGKNTHNQVIIDLLNDPVFQSLEWSYRTIRRVRKQYHCQPDWGGKREKGKKIP